MVLVSTDRFLLANTFRGHEADTRNFQWQRMKPGCSGKRQRPCPDNCRADLKIGNVILKVQSSLIGKKKHIETEIFFSGFQYSSQVLNKCNSAAPVT